MQYLILGACLLIGGVLLINWFVNTDPKTVARVVRVAAVIGASGVFVFLAVTGRFGVALGLLFGALPLFLRWRAVANRLKAAYGPATGQRSTVETSYLHVELDHDSGEMNGEVRRGRFTGQTLADLGSDELLALLEECRSADPQSAAILEAFLDRSYGGDWRQWRHPGARAQAPQDGNAMTREEAYRMLGLEPGASDQAIKEAHRRLMKKFHPDHGGSDYIAAKLNQAKDMLLGS